MYESQFGLSGPPFQLSPDPAFFYDSRGHSHALAYLKYGAHQGEGFIIVTGEIGAGKTTVVRALLQLLDSRKVVAAQIVSTQLGSGDLLRSILIAFGVPVLGESKAQLISTIEAFLTSLAAEGRRALLIIDEAQNLGRESIEELRMLSNFQLGTHTLMQSFLVGQPELRTLLKSKAMEQLRQRITASCHLGALDCVDTRKYIEHRLNHVGWSGTPGFTIAAYERIHAWTGGVPRRINRLCNRLFLSAYLQDEKQISEAMVLETANELQSEIGELSDRMPLDATPVGDDVDAGAERPAAAPAPEARQLPAPSRAGPARTRPLLLLCDSPSGYWKLAALAHALMEVADLPSIAIVHTGGERIVGQLQGFALPKNCSCVHLGIAGGDYAKVMSTAIPRFDALLGEMAPSGVLVAGVTDAALACALLASKRGATLLRLDAGLRRTEVHDTEINTLLLDRLADELLTRSAGDSHALIREGEASDRVHFVGSLTPGFLDFALSQMPPADRVLDDFDLVPSRLEGRYGVITWRCPPAGSAQRFVTQVLPVLRVFAKDIPLVWPVRAAERTALIVAGVDAQLADAGVTVVRERGYIEGLALLRHARCLVTDSRGDFAEEAEALGRMHIIAGTDVEDADLPGEDGQIVVGLEPELAARAARAVMSDDGGRPAVAGTEQAIGRASLRVARWLIRWLGYEPRPALRSLETIE